MDNYINEEMCRDCKGVCCKNNDCIYSPQDFEIIEFEYLKSLIDKGRISISGQPFSIFENTAWSYLVYLRARNIDSPIVDLMPKGGPCINLDDNGCILKREEMPAFGKTLEPIQIGGPCKQHFTDKDIMKWIEYSDTLERLVEYYSNSSFCVVLKEQLLSCKKDLLEEIRNSQKLSNMEQIERQWFCNIIANKKYYSIDNYKRLLIV